MSVYCTGCGEQALSVRFEKNFCEECAGWLDEQVKVAKGISFYRSSRGNFFEEIYVGRWDDLEFRVKCDDERNGCMVKVCDFDDLVMTSYKESLRVWVRDLLGELEWWISGKKELKWMEKYRVRQNLLRVEKVKKEEEMKNLERKELMVKFEELLGSVWEGDRDRVRDLVRGKNSEIEIKKVIGNVRIIGEECGKKKVCFVI